MGILVIGSSNTDLVVRSERMPKPGETVLGGEFFVNAGGKGANQAVGAARVGADVSFCCRVGDDDYGKNSIDIFKKDGINTEYVFKTQGCPSGVAIIVVDSKGENSIVVASGANLKLAPEDIDSIEDLSSYSIALAQLEIPVETVERAAFRCHSEGVKFVLNPAPACKLPESLIKLIDVITPNETETEILTGIKVTDEDSATQAAQVLCKMGVNTVIITMGSKGAFLYQDGKGELIPAFEVQAVDTTAAGDIFNGALCAAMCEGKDIKEAVLFAQAASSISVTRKGAQPSAPTRSEVESKLGSNN